ALVDAAYPMLTLPPELASSWTMIHAISRQETQFDRMAVSGANARGLMQLLPVTAAEQAAKLGLPYATSRLTDDSVFNVTLGSAYYARIRDNLGGSHLLAVAAYNAGPGNVRRFIAMNGDPRLPGADLVDWVELIPFSETRDYVQRVLANAVVYDILHPATATMPAVNRLSAYLGKRTPG
ncbi:MAG: lytic transglycosylase domain-containing protein, partial [Sphingomonadaceae bacterium]|nr:lytic transglycosylase domain-containing protein [Sphingomonadaceae bacterium]